MKRILILLIISCSGLAGFAQLSSNNASDNNVPPPLPPPQPPCFIYLNQKLVSFSLPCCIDTIKNVRDIATVKLIYPPVPPNPKGCKIVYRPCNVTFEPAKISPPAAVVASNTETVKATCGAVSLTATTEAVNGNISLGVTPVSFNFANIGKTFDNAISAIMNGGVSPCKPSGSLIPTGSISIDASKICCPGNVPCVKTSYKVSGNVSWNYGATCHFPIFGCPYVASLDAVLSANASVTIGASRQTGCTEGKFCVNGNGTLTAGGGVGATLLAGFVSADLQLLVSGGLTASYCFRPPPPAGTANLTLGPVQVVGTVSAAWGLISHSVSYTVFGGWNSPPINF